MAQFFINHAKNTENLVATSHYIAAAAAGLWSAIDIYIRKVDPEEKKPSAEYPLLSGHASKWFKENERLVNYIRHSQTHYDWRVEVASLTRPPDVSKPSTVLVIVRGKRVEQIPITEVISRLEAVCDRVNDLISKQTGTTSFDFR